MEREREGGERKETASRMGAKSSNDYAKNKCLRKYARARETERERERKRKRERERFEKFQSKHVVPDEEMREREIKLPRRFVTSRKLL